MFHDIRLTSKKIKNRITQINGLVYRHRSPIPSFRFRYLHGPMEPRFTDTDIDDSSWDVVLPHDYWANPRTNFVLRSIFTVPESFDDQNPIAIYLPIGIAGNFSHPEALVYIDGKPFASCDRHHQEIILVKEFCDNEEHKLALHGWTGIGGTSIEEMTNRLKMNPCDVVQIHQATRDFVATARVAFGVSDQLDERDPTKHHLINSLDESLQLLDIRSPIGDNFYDSVLGALETLNTGIQSAGDPIGVNIHAIGHAHIDVAWLWTLEQTRQKASRTFTNVLKLMEHYPNFIFAQSQPQLYDFIRKDFPLIYKAIQERVREGRWEILGGMWVEADCNLSGPESLARQFLLGRNFFREEFGEGTESPVLWLPDVFGYAWNLPQLIKEAGLEYFFTIKIGWSQYNRLPFDSFWWQGLDGTKVLTHFSTTKDPDSPHAATYNSDASPSQTIGTWLNFQQKDYAPPGEVPPLLMSYGYGDGGGGPTREMIENIHHMAHFPSTPSTKPGKVGDFFRDLEDYGENLPIWNGELYLEYHRGTYTTQARNKKANRESEFLLHDAEFLATYASLLDRKYEYPYGQLKKAWELVCLNQFHDIIPGSSISEVYKESLSQYQEVREIGEDIREHALRIISIKLGKGNIAVNPTSFHRNEVVEVGTTLKNMGNIPAYSVRKIDSSTTNPPNTNLSIDQNTIENDFLRIEINENGDISRIYDKIVKRDVIPDEMVSNQFLAFEDIPLSWDAWDIDIFYDDKVWLAEKATEINVTENGPYRAVLEIKRKILNSSYTQLITLTHNSPRIDFDTIIDWQERQILLKVAFPVAILSPTATYEIQWGNVERPTHRNTSWDWARFETAAQKWVDLSEGGYGVSLLNNCKYGHDIHENNIRIHKFRYSLLPHSGSWGQETVREAYAINDPLIIYQPNFHDDNVNVNAPSNPGDIDHLPSLVSVDNTNIIIETIKQAEDGNGIIIRLYEYQRIRCRFSIKTVFPMSGAWRTNLLEENQEKIPVDGSKLEYSIKPYQIVTLRLVPNI